MLELFELAYLSCYGVVAADFLMTWTTATQMEVDRFWTAVLLAVYGCYGTLPWLSTRALPGAMPHAVDRLRVRRVNLALLRYGGVGWNTLPSAHVAGALAAALASAQFSTTISIVLALAALGIAAGAVIGRYHYTYRRAARTAPWPVRLVDRMTGKWGSPASRVGRKRQIAHRVQTGRRAENLRNRIDDDRSGGDVTMHTTGNLHGQRRRPDDAHRIV